MTADNTNGASLFTQFKRFQLKTQYRVTKNTDPKHVAFIDELRNPKRKYPISKALVKSLKQLSPQDIKNDPLFRYAPIVTTTNCVRQRLNYLQACRSDQLAAA